MKLKLILFSLFAIGFIGCTKSNSNKNNAKIDDNLVCSIFDIGMAQKIVGEELKPCKVDKKIRDDIQSTTLVSKKNSMPKLSIVYYKDKGYKLSHYAPPKSKIKRISNKTIVTLIDKDVSEIITKTKKGILLVWFLYKDNDPIDSEVFKKELNFALQSAANAP